jgi:deazaflavin-dependent oxidoreductase (nitroreductase family)
MSNGLQRFFARIAATESVTKAAAGLIHRIDGPLLNVTGGRLAPSSVFTGMPVALVTTIGAKSGQTRTLPLVVIPDGAKFALIASNFGSAKYPAWYHNLRANPKATVTFGRTTKEFAAREATDAEYEKYWNEAVRLYRGYEAYKTRTGGRRIPVMVLEEG